MTKTLRISPDLELPLSFATEGVVAVGMRGSGKSNTLVRWAEVLDEARIPFVAIDPKGDWYGIRSSADGKSPGLSVPVFGGRNGDFPLTEHLGDDIAHLLVDQSLSAVLDVSVLGKAARARFLTAFCHTLMDRHKAEPHVRCVILEEAHSYIPQQVPGELAKCKEACSAILLEGRAFGLGCWAATQRPARLHKDVLEEVGTAVLHRIGAAATNDLRTISGWVKHEDLSDEIVPSLSRLEAGEAWVLAPATLGVAQRVTIDRRRTFDSGATPLVGAGSRPTITLADVDTAAIKEQLADAVEKAKESDPRHLQARIRHLEAELDWWNHFETKLGPDSQLPRKGSPLMGDKYRLRRDPDPDEIIQVIHDEIEVKIPVVPDDVSEAVRLAADHIGIVAAALKGLVETIDNLPRLVVGPSEPVRVDSPNGPRISRRSLAPRREAAPPERIEPSGDGTIGGGAPTTILQVLAHHPAGLPKNRAAALAQIPQKKSTLRNALSELRGAGFISGSDFIVPTDAGLAYIGSVPDLPTGDDLYEHWRTKLNPTEFACFAYLIKIGGVDATKDEIAAACDIDPSKSTLRNALSRLRTLGLMQGMHADPDVEASINGG